MKLEDDMKVLLEFWVQSNPIVFCVLWELNSDTKNDCQNPELMTYGRRPIIRCIRLSSMCFEHRDFHLKNILVTR